MRKEAIFADSVEPPYLLPYSLDWFDVHATYSTLCRRKGKRGGNSSPRTR